MSDVQAAAAGPAPADPFAGPQPSGRRGTIAHSPPLPVQGWAEVALPVERLWATFLDVPRWPTWNPCFWRSSVKGGDLRVGATLRFAFNPIESRYLYKLRPRRRSWKWSRTTE